MKPPVPSRDPNPASTRLWSHGRVGRFCPSPAGGERPAPVDLPLRDDPGGAGAGRCASTPALGGRSGRGPAKIKLIAVLRFDPGAGRQPEPLARGPALLRLLDNSVAACSGPRAVLSAFEGSTLDAHAFEAARGDADETVARLMSILSE
jgi:hypothetical protein